MGKLLLWLLALVLHLYICLMLLLLPLLEILVPSFMVQSQGFRVPMHQVKNIAARKPTLTIRSVRIGLGL